MLHGHELFLTHEAEVSPLTSKLVWHWASNKRLVLWEALQLEGLKFNAPNKCSQIIFPTIEGGIAIRICY